MQSRMLPSRADTKQGFPVSLHQSIGAVSSGGSRRMAAISHASGQKLSSRSFVHSAVSPVMEWVVIASLRSRLASVTSPHSNAMTAAARRISFRAKCSPFCPAWLAAFTARSSASRKCLSGGFLAAATRGCAKGFKAGCLLHQYVNLVHDIDFWLADRGGCRQIIGMVLNDFARGPNPPARYHLPACWQFETAIRQPAHQPGVSPGGAV
jgi:hypothetical protein